MRRGSDVGWVADADQQPLVAVGEGAKASLSAFDHLIRTSAPA